MDPYRLYDQNKDNLLIHIEQTPMHTTSQWTYSRFNSYIWIQLQKISKASFFLNITKGRGAIFEKGLDWKVGEG